MAIPFSISPGASTPQPLVSLVQKRTGNLSGQFIVQSVEQVTDKKRDIFLIQLLALVKTGKQQFQ